MLDLGHGETSHQNGGKIEDQNLIAILWYTSFLQSLFNLWRQMPNVKSFELRALGIAQFCPVTFKETLPQLLPKIQKLSLNFTRAVIGSNSSTALSLLSLPSLVRLDNLLWCSMTSGEEEMVLARAKEKNLRPVMATKSSRNAWLTDDGFCETCIF